LHPYYRLPLDTFEVESWFHVTYFLVDRLLQFVLNAIFYDDLNEETPELGMPWEQCFGFMQAVGNGFGDVYKTIVDRRQGIAWTSAQREYQLHRRGRGGASRALQL
jgi:coproporphyrinogen III oxidase